MLLPSPTHRSCSKKILLGKVILTVPRATPETHAGFLHFSNTRLQNGFTQSITLGLCLMRKSHGRLQNAAAETLLVDVGWQGRDGTEVTRAAAGVGRDGQVKAELIVFVILQVLYKTAWSESVGRDCAAYCAKKWV